MTLTELARLAHVSTSTASKAFSMSPEVHDETRSMIFEIAKRNGCFKKFYRSEYNGYVIAVICPEFESTYYSSFLSSLESELRRNGAEMTVAESGFSEENTVSLIEYYDKFSTVDGIIIIDPAIKELPKREIPVATVGGSLKKRGDITVIRDSRSAIFEGVSRFVSLGVSDIGCIIDKYTSGRRENLREAMEHHGMELREENTVVSDERFELGGYLGMKEFIRRGKIPRAVLIAYDRMAVGALRALSEEGLGCPSDVAVLSLDDAPQSEYMTPSLSSINLSIDESSKRVTKAILAKIAGEEYEQTIEIKCVLKKRETTDIK